MFIQGAILVANFKLISFLFEKELMILTRLFWLHSANKGHIYKFDIQWAFFHEQNTNLIKGSSIKDVDRS